MPCITKKNKVFFIASTAILPKKKNKGDFIKLKPEDNESNMQNGNWGTPGTNNQWDEVQKNRNQQLLESRDRRRAK